MSKPLSQCLDEALECAGRLDASLRRRLLQMARVGGPVQRHFEAALGAAVRRTPHRTEEIETLVETMAARDAPPTERLLDLVGDGPSLELLDEALIRMALCSGLVVTAPNDTRWRHAPLDDEVVDAVVRGERLQRAERCLDRAELLERLASGSMRWPTVLAQAMNPPERFVEYARRIADELLGRGLGLGEAGWTRDDCASRDREAVVERLVALATAPRAQRSEHARQVRRSTLELLGQDRQHEIIVDALFAAGLTPTTDGRIVSRSTERHHDVW